MLEILSILSKVQKTYLASILLLMAPGDFAMTTDLRNLPLRTEIEGEDLEERLTSSCCCCCCCGMKWVLSLVPSWP